MESAKTTNPAKQWRQQNPQKPSTHKHHQLTNPSAKLIHKPKTSNHRPHASTNSQTFQTHKIFITSPLWLSNNLPPTTPQQTQTNNPNQNLQNSNTLTKNPYHLSPIQIKTDPLQNPQPWGHHKDKERGEISEPTTTMTPKSEERIRSYGLKGQRKIEKL
ncbi:hypothetical protein ACB094_07G148000 [Castanea mollissima]